MLKWLWKYELTSTPERWVIHWFRHKMHFLWSKNIKYATVYFTLRLSIHLGTENQKCTRTAPPRFGPRLRLRQLWQLLQMCKQVMVLLFQGSNPCLRHPRSIVLGKIALTSLLPDQRTRNVHYCDFNCHWERSYVNLNANSSHSRNSLAKEIWHLKRLTDYMKKANKNFNFNFTHSSLYLVPNKLRTPKDMIDY